MKKVESEKDRVREVGVNKVLLFRDTRVSTEQSELSRQVDPRDSKLEKKSKKTKLKFCNENVKCFSTLILKQ